MKYECVCSRGSEGEAIKGSLCARLTLCRVYYIDHAYSLWLKRIWDLEPSRSKFEYYLSNSYNFAQIILALYFLVFTHNIGFITHIFIITVMFGNTVCEITRIQWVLKTDICHCQFFSYIFISFVCFSYMKVSSIISRGDRFYNNRLYNTYPKNMGALVL